MYVGRKRQDMLTLEQCIQRRQSDRLDQTMVRKISINIGEAAPVHVLSIDAGRERLMLVILRGPSTKRKDFAALLNDFLL
jgi:hypothetical protein